MAQIDHRPRIRAVLGPTNTGKTWLAIDRMLGHQTGIIGFPLRLLARENYDRVAERVGARNVALVTGEEKIIPPTARYFLCTVEAMPLDRPVDFLAIDEVQLCSDDERGYVFTDRVLRARGRLETVFLGSETMEPILNILVPDAEIEKRQRFSRLGWGGVRKLTRIRRKTAIVAFSANDVYRLAEQVRQNRGGAAVVLGALSPRTRNAQVEMYQAGEVDYLVATDAIGMGLNLEIDHVLFSGLKKFDGTRFRGLTVPEIAQIAGRAGRYTNDGTFGTLAEIGPLEEEIIHAVENNNFDPIRRIWWRNADLEFASLRDLFASLDAAPPLRLLTRTRQAEDYRALKRLARDQDIKSLAASRDQVRLLWEVCQIPDFRKTVPEAHIRLLARIYTNLCAADRRLPHDWVARQISHLNRFDGDIDTLMTRIAHTRTWTYITHRSDWIEDAAHWRDQARALEDRLSDALHAKLTERFVDRRSAALVQAKSKDALDVRLDADDGVLVEGEYVGQFTGLRFAPEASVKGEERRLILTMARRALGGEIAARVRQLSEDLDDKFSLGADGTVCWRDQPVARLFAGRTVLTPSLRIDADGFLPNDLRQHAEHRLDRWLAAYVETQLKPLIDIRDGDFSGAARGLVYQMVERLGSVSRKDASEQIAALTPEDRKALRRHQVRLGPRYVYIASLLKPRAAFLRAVLWCVAGEEKIFALPDPGIVSPIPDPAIPHGFYDAIGYFPAGGRVMRADILDRLTVRLMHLSRNGAFDLPEDVASTLGLGNEETANVLRDLGYRKDKNTGEFLRKHRPRKKQARKKNARSARRRKHRAADPASPFAVLSQLRAP